MALSSFSPLPVAVGAATFSALLSLECDQRVAEVADLRSLTRRPCSASRSGDMSTRYAVVSRDPPITLVIGRLAEGATSGCLHTKVAHNDSRERDCTESRLHLWQLQRSFPPQHLLLCQYPLLVFSVCLLSCILVQLAGLACAWLPGCTNCMSLVDLVLIVALNTRNLVEFAMVLVEVCVAAQPGPTQRKPWPSQARWWVSARVQLCVHTCAVVCAHV